MNEKTIDRSSVNAITVSLMIIAVCAIVAVIMMMINEWRYQRMSRDLNRARESVTQPAEPSPWANDLVEELAAMRNAEEN